MEWSKSEDSQVISGNHNKDMMFVVGTCVYNYYEVAPPIYGERERGRERERERERRSRSRERKRVRKKENKTDTRQKIRESHE